MEFRTIKEDGQVQEEIKKSRFICHVKRVYSEEEARAMLVRGFLEPISKELPLEYAVEMNNLINLELEGSIG